MRDESQEFDQPTLDTPTAGQPENTGSLSTASGVARLLSQPLPFPTWDRYSLVTALGAGGMGSVYKAHDPRLHRYVAIKFLRDSLQNGVSSSELAERFYREARAQAGIEHEHICKIYEVGEVEGRPYIAMQCIEGETLNSGRKRLTLPQKVLVIRQVAEALHCAHRQGLIHRDIKPGKRGARPARRGFASCERDADTARGKKRWRGGSGVGSVCD